MGDYVNYGLITLLPPLFIVVFAIITKLTFEALALGGLICYMISDRASFFTTYVDQAIFGVLTDYDSMWIIMIIGLFGSLIALMERTKGTIGFAKWLEKYANTPKKTLMYSFFLGLAIFVDDYLNTLAVATSMLRVADKQKIPREMMAYVIASTGASDCTVIPFSTWVVYYAGLFAAIPELAPWGATGNGLSFYYHMVPTIFYGWTCLLVVPLVVFGVIPIFGPMKKAYNRVATTGMVYSTDSAKYNKTAEDDDGEHSSLWLFVAPIILMVLITIVLGDMLFGVLGGVGLLILMIIITRKMTLREISDTVMTGFGNMTQMNAIILAALAVKISMANINLPNYIIEAALPYMKPSIFPLLSFIIVATIAWFTGSNWGIPAVTVPILMPLAVAGGANVILTASAIVSGGVFSSHACFYSDCTVLTSAATRIEVMEHNLTQIPYALISAAIAILLFGVCGVFDISLMPAV
jgi:Na+/H+ antiporter NhaC